MPTLDLAMLREFLEKQRELEKNNIHLYIYINEPPHLAPNTVQSERQEKDTFSRIKTSKSH